MEKRAFGKTGFEVSVLGFGGGPVGYLETDKREVAKMLNMLLDRGINLIDTAASYQGSEIAIGEAVSHRRDEYVLISKCGRVFDDMKGEPWSATIVEQTVDRALRRLKTDHLDAMLLHSCELEILQRGEALGALAKARDAGKVRFYGYSGDNEAAIYAARQKDVAVIETSVNICDQANIDTLLPLTQKNNIGVLAKRPVANASWREASEQGGMYVDYTRGYSDRIRKMGIKPTDLGFPDNDYTTWAEMALRFTLSQPGVCTAIVGTTKPANAERNLAVAEKGPLPAETVARIRDAFRRAEAASGETWPGSR